MQLMMDAKNIVAKRLGYFVSLILVTELLGPLVAFGVVMILVVTTAAVYTASDSIAIAIIPGIVAVAALIGAIILELMFSIAPMLAVSDERMTSIKSAIQASKGKVLVYFLTNLLMTILVAVGLILLVIPGIYLAVAFSVSLWVAVFEQTSAPDALRRSKELVQGRWWAVFGRLFAFTLVVWIFAGVPGAIFEAINAEILSVIYYVIFGILITPFATAYGYVLYKSLKNTQMTTPVSPAPAPAAPQM